MVTVRLGGYATYTLTNQCWFDTINVLCGRKMTSNFFVVRSSDP